MFDFQQFVTEWSRIFITIQLGYQYPLSNIHDGIELPTFAHPPDISF